MVSHASNGWGRRWEAEFCIQVLSQTWWPVVVRPQESTDSLKTVPKFDTSGGKVTQRGELKGALEANLFLEQTAL